MTKVNSLRVLLAASVAALTAFLLTMLATENPVQAAFPGENGRIAFTSFSLTDPSTSYDTYTMLPDGTGRTQLTSDLRRDSDPAWSSDGTRIAFVSDAQHDGSGDEIYVMDADG